VRRKNRKNRARHVASPHRRFVAQRKFKLKKSENR
jgi:hypothetical protein